MISRAFCSQVSANCLSWRRIAAPVSCWSCVSRISSKRRVASAWLRPLSSCSVCRCRSRSLDSSSLRLVGLLDLLGQLALRGLDDLFLLADLLGLLFQGVLALVEEAFALVELAADLAQLLFAFVLLLEHQLLDFQLALAAAVFRLLLGLGDDLGGLALGVLPPQVIEDLDQNEGHPEGCNSRKDDGDDLPRGCHDYVPRSSRAQGAWQRQRARPQPSAARSHSLAMRLPERQTSASHEPPARNGGVDASRRVQWNPAWTTAIQLRTAAAWLVRWRRPYQHTPSLP